MERARGLPRSRRPPHCSMAQDLRTARRAEHTVARWTTFLLFACLLLEAGTLVSRFSHRAQLPRLTAGAPPLPPQAAAPDARDRATAPIRLAAPPRAPVLSA